jgi:hypothetical protein
MIEDRDEAIAALEAAGVIVRAGDDARGVPMYRFNRFPSGADGEALKALFDRRIHGRDGQRRE